MPEVSSELDRIAATYDTRQADQSDADLIQKNQTLRSSNLQFPAPSNQANISSSSTTKYDEYGHRRSNLQSHRVDESQTSPGLGRLAELSRKDPKIDKAQQRMSSTSKDEMESKPHPEEPRPRKDGKPRIGRVTSV